jgi:hypothetical protein
MLPNQVVYELDILPNRDWADLFVIAYHHDLLAKSKRKQSHNIALARFVNDHHIKLCCPKIKIIDEPRDGHNPNGDGLAARLHLFASFLLKFLNPLPVTLPNTSYNIKPADQILASCTGRSNLLGPGATFNQLDRSAIKLFSHGLDLSLQVIDIDLQSLSYFIRQLTPSPSSYWVAR